MTKPITQDSNTKIRLFLSRRIYSTESSVIGCVLVPPDLQISSLNIYVAGRGRLDSRWHDVQSVKKYYGTHPCHDDLPNWVERFVEESYFLNPAARKKSNAAAGSLSSKSDKSNFETESICFWSTNVLTLYDQQGLQVPYVGEHSIDSRNEDESVPLAMSGSDWFQRASQFLEILHGNEEDHHGDSVYRGDSSSSSGDSYSSDDNDSDNDNDSDRSSDGASSCTSSNSHGHDDETRDVQGKSGNSCNNGKYFTFRCDLPADISPTVNATSVRYYYSVVVYALCSDGKSIVVQAPFTVVSPGEKIGNTNDGMKTKISIGSVYALSHCSPYLLPLSLAYKSEPWSVSVCRKRHGHGVDASTNHKTITVGENGCVCGWLTIMGGGRMAPGDCIDLRFIVATTATHEYDMLPCYQVSACLQGAEYAININKDRAKCRSYIFDTDFERIYPGASNLISLSLNLPEQCPGTISTDFVEICVTCRIDFTVKAKNSSSFRFLTVEFPCSVVCGATKEEDDDEDRRLPASLENQILDLKWPAATDHAVERRIVSSEVISDLNMLSLYLHGEAM
mmetsp:Transcript_7967/g.15002  ORF Transcript_7967/g.15002 Transcript_7967/m.15002 type:complete len:564 (+) Transcript_7967:60-1751(+)